MVKKIGIAVAGHNVAHTLEIICDLDQKGIEAAWLTVGGAAGADPLSTLTAAASRTEQIKLGTSIMPTWTRHPIIAAQQALAIAQLAPNRFRLGVGPSHKEIIERVYGIKFQSPLLNLKEYLIITKALLQEGSVEFDGLHYSAHNSIGITAPDVPVMASALRVKSFELCGELADGAISWICPPGYLRDVALPALQRGAARSGRERPPLVVHVPMCIHENLTEALDAAQAQFGRYVQMPFYTRMLAEAGFPQVGEKGWDNASLNSVTLIGTEENVAEGLDDIFGWGADEILVSVIEAGNSKEKSRDRSLRFLSGYRFQQ